jgi:predicted O-methyltransferase YrrM
MTIQAPIVSIETVLKQKTSWVRLAINDAEARALAHEITCGAAKVAIEIGVGSGHSSAVIWAALNCSEGRTARLFAYDKSPTLYYDRTRKTGDAFSVVHGAQPGYVLTTGRTSDQIAALGDGTTTGADFAFIDASHRSPWPALDVLSIARFLRPNAVIALHDLDMPLTPDFRGDHNGARDLFRCWQGDKWRFKEAPNLGFIRRGSDDLLARSVAVCISIDWDESLLPDQIAAFDRIAASYGPAGDPVRGALAARCGSGRRKIDAYIS